MKTPSPVTSIAGSHRGLVAKIGARVAAGSPSVEGYNRVNELSAGSSLPLRLCCTILTRSSTVYGVPVLTPRPCIVPCRESSGIWRSTTQYLLKMLKAPSDQGGIEMLE